MRSIILKTALLAAAMAGVIAAAFAFIPTVTVQRGYSGTAMQHVAAKADVDKLAAANVMPTALPRTKAGQRSSEAYQNVKVLGNLTTAEFTRLMLTMTQWVSPVEGCNYCHNPANMASDEKYAKVVARRMIQMTQHVNANWQSHVKETGVTCYTCHRGQPVPANLWFDEPKNTYAQTSLLGDRAGQNLPSNAVAMASLPSDIVRPYLSEAESIRVTGKTALPTTNRQSIKQTEWTYGLMMHMSTSLGVNCTYCHNSRQFADWSQSPLARTTAWYGIRMVRDVNRNYLESLAGVFPANRLGPSGDVPKVNCATCHNGAFKPLLGQSMLKDFEELAAPYVPTGTTAFQKTLGTGFAVKGNESGVEAKLIGFIEDAARVVDAMTWFDFDRLNFATGSAELDAAASQAQLDNVAEILRAFPALRLKVGGYTDNVGDPAANKTLSQDRATAVVTALTGRGIDAARLEAEGYGSDHPVCAANDTEDCRAQNRRIAMRVLSK
jgi:photosynthetic reaction center cytochrome c subunit